MITLDLTEAAALPETPDLDGAFPRLAQAQLDILLASCWATVLGMVVLGMVMP